MKRLLLVLLVSTTSSFCFAESEGAPAFPEIGKVYSVTWAAGSSEQPSAMKVIKFLGGTWYSAEVFMTLNNQRTVGSLYINFAHVSTAREIIAGLPPLTEK
jgi:hypothetical protein